MADLTAEDLGDLLEASALAAFAIDWEVRLHEASSQLSWRLTAPTRDLPRHVAGWLATRVPRLRARRERHLSAARDRLLEARRQLADRLLTPASRETVEATKALLLAATAPSPAPVARPEPQIDRIDPAGQAACVYVHAYYPDVLGEILDLLAQRRLTPELPLILSINNDAIGNELDLERIPNCRVYRFDNRGRDVLPFVTLLRGGAFDGFRCVCKIHTKKSPHRPDGAAWRRTCIDELLPGRAEVARIVQLFRAGEGGGAVGMVGPASHYIPLGQDPTINDFRFNWMARRLTDRPLAVAEAGFFAGTMFWFSPSRLMPLQRLALGPDLFEREMGQLHSCLNHILERIFPLAALAGGAAVHSTDRRGRLRLRLAPPPAATPAGPARRAAFAAGREERPN